MIATFGVKAGVAMRAMIITVLVLVDGHLPLANATENRSGIKFMFTPYFSFMSCRFFMAVKAGIVSVAAFKLNSDHIKWRMIMGATCLLINCFSFYFNHCNSV
jgi:hypothetical protein